VRKSLCLLLVAAAVVAGGCRNRYEELDLSMYQYRDTKDLVKFVYDAAEKLKSGGAQALEYFRDNRSLYNQDGHYLYIYDMDGVNIYHAGMKNLEGKNLWEVTDRNGKKITQLIMDALKNPDNPHAWVHYSWWQPGKFYPVPKSSCHFMVRMPNGKDVYVGGGINYPHEEKEFVRIVVDSAVDLIRKDGTSAYAEISNPASQYSYRDVQVFAFRPDGTVVISPVVDGEFSQMNLLDCVDEVGHKPFAQAVEQFKTRDKVWDVFMAKNKYQRDLVKKCLYLRKVMVNGKEIYVGAISDLPQPS